MRAQPLSAVVRFLDRVRAQGAAAHCDAELLARFAAQREPAALEALVRRHGPAVLGVCRRVLGAGPNAEDAFQATFLVLARKAASIRKRDAVGSWLHGVALRLSRQTRSQMAARRRRETNLGPAVEDLPMDADPGRAVYLGELGSIIDEELQRLPPMCRAAIVACYLENNSTAQAAKHLGIPASTLKSRLERGRELLRVRLSKRGVGLSAVALAVWLTEQGRALAAPALVRATVEAAVSFAATGAAGVSAQVGALATKGLKAAPLLKVTVALVASAAVGLLGLAATVAIPSGPKERGTIPAAQGPLPLTKSKVQPPVAAKDLFGDPLPPGAIARLGTVRWRHNGFPRFIAILPDSKTVITSGDGAVHLWDRASGREVRRFEPGPSNSAFQGFSTQAAAVSKDGKLLAGSWNKAEIHLWEIEGGKALVSIPLDKDGPQVAGLVFSPDDKQLAIVNKDGGIRIWDFAASKIIRAFGPSAGQRPDSMPYSSDGALAYAPDGNSIVSIVPGFSGQGEHVNVINFWDPATGQVQRKLEEFGSSRPSHPVFSPDGKRLAFVANKEICVFDIKAGRLLFKQAGKPGSAWNWWPQAVFSADSTKLYVVPGQNRAVLEYDATTGKPLRELGDGDKESGSGAGMNTVSALTLSPDGKLLGICDVGNAVRFVELGSGKDVPVAGGHSSPLLYLAYSGDAKSVRTGANDFTARLWDAASAAETKLLPLPVNSGKCVPSADGRHIVSQLDGNTTLELFDTVKKQVVGSLPGGPLQSGKNVSFFLSPDDRTLFVYRQIDGTIVLYDMPSLKERCRVAANTNMPLAEQYQPGAYYPLPLSFFFSPDGKHLAVTEGITAIGVWEVDTGKLRQRLKLADETIVDGGAFSPDGRAIVLSLQDGTMPVLELASGRQRSVLGKLPDFKKDQGKGKQVLLTSGVYRAIIAQSAAWLAISPDSRLLATSGASLDKALHLWDIAAGTEVAKLPGHWGNIYTVAFAPDGNSVATGSSDSTALIWDLKGLRAKAGPEPRELDGAALDACWTALAADDAVAAFAAINQLAAAPQHAIPFLKDHLKPTVTVDGARVDKLIGLVDDAEFKTRQKAVADLVQLGEQVVPYVTKALAQKNSLEMNQRLEALKARLAGPPWTGEQVRSIRAVEAIERLGTPEALALLQTLANGAPGAVLTTNAEEALKRLR